MNLDLLPPACRCVVVALLGHLGILVRSQADAAMNVNFRSRHVSMSHLEARIKMLDAGARFVKVRGVQDFLPWYQLQCRQWRWGCCFDESDLIFMLPTPAQGMEDAANLGKMPANIKPLQDSFNQVLQGLEIECLAVKNTTGPRPSRMEAEALDHVNEMMDVISALRFSYVKGPDAATAMSDLLETMMPNATGEYAPAARLTIQLLYAIRKMLTTSAADAMPRSAEAKRLLSFFLNSLTYPRLPRPTFLTEQKSLVTLTPVYEEDVVYALDAQATLVQMGMDPNKVRGNMTDLVGDRETGVSLLTYLKSLFPLDWENFQVGVAVWGVAVCSCGSGCQVASGGWWVHFLGGCGLCWASTVACKLVGLQPDILRCLPSLPHRSAFRASLVATW